MLEDESQRPPTRSIKRPILKRGKSDGEFHHYIRKSIERKTRPGDVSLLRDHFSSLFASDVELLSQSITENGLFTGRKIVRRHSSFDVMGKDKPRRMVEDLMLIQNEFRSVLGLVSPEVVHEDSSKGFETMPDLKGSVSSDDGGVAKAGSHSAADDQDSIFPVVIAGAGVVLGGVGSYVALERLNAIDPGCGSVITLLQYFAAVIEKSPHAVEYISTPIIPIQWHFAFCAFFFIASWLGSICLMFDLPFPLYLIIKNSNMVFSLILGFTVLRRRYPLGKILSVALVSVGVVVAVLSQKGGSAQEPGATSSKTMVGVALCVLATLAMACLGCTQDIVFSKYKTEKGTAPTSEAMFYTHVLGLPFFLRGSLLQHVLTLKSKWKDAVPLVCINVASMVICKQSIFRLLDISSSLTTSMAVTLSRVTGIVVSVCFLSDAALPGLRFWAGAVAVMVGSITYILSGNKTKRD